MPSFPSRSEPSILQKVAQVIDAKSKAMLPGQEVKKHGYNLLALHDKQDMADMKAAEGAADQVTIRDCMPEAERDATTSEEASQIANNLFTSCPGNMALDLASITCATFCRIEGSDREGKLGISISSSAQFEVLSS